MEKKWPKQRERKNDAPHPNFAEEDKKKLLTLELFHRKLENFQYHNTLAISPQIYIISRNVEIFKYLVILQRSKFCVKEIF